MSTATLSSQRVNRPNMVAIGTIVWLSSELMFFAALFAMYFTLRAVNPDVWKIETELLDKYPTQKCIDAMLSTCVHLAGSDAIEMAADYLGAEEKLRAETA